uniref:Lipid droplet-associated hydrolase n=1 Tax=Sphenodon punctatus TaxID=8508 RepID=A0A8D0H524_SPHPU
MKTTSEEQVPLHEEFIYCSGAATQVLKCGPWKDLQKDESKDLPKLLFLVVPGNPGLVSFYKTFIQALYCGFNQQYPVWIVSHAGHCKPPGGMKMTEDTGMKELDDVFGLSGQIEHKLNFVRKNVPEDTKLVLIGHSIGCYIILEMMKRVPELQVLRCLLLFPTIERMAESPHGKIMTPLLCKLRYLLYVPLYLMTFLPERVQISLLRYWMQGIKYDDSFIVTSLDLYYMGCSANAMYIASQEMMKVVERDNTTIRQNLKKLIFYYGSRDKWCPTQYYDEMKKDFPDGDIRLCERRMNHAFVLHASKEMADMIADWLEDDLAKL